MGQFFKSDSLLEPIVIQLRNNCRSLWNEESAVPGRNACSVLLNSLLMRRKRGVFYDSKELGTAGMLHFPGGRGERES